MASTSEGTLIQPRVSIAAFRVITIVTFALSLLIVAFRFFAWVHQRKHPGLDGILLIISTVFLIAGTTTLLLNLDTLYFFEFVILNGVEVLSPSQFTILLDKLVWFQQMQWAYSALSWSAIFFVKFSFLTLFSGLCERLPRMELYRKAVYTLCVLVFIYCVLSNIVLCPFLGLEEISCSTPASLQRLLDYGDASIVLDVFTDLLIIFIPINLLWKVNLRIYQKAAIGVFLCLSLVMIVVAVIKVAGVKYYGSAEIIWGGLWQQVEACAAVSMVSLTAFRSVFVSPTSSRDKPWKASIPDFLKRVRGSSNSNLNDVSIPRATITGMRTAIGNVEEDDIAFPEQSATNMYHSGLSEKSFA